MEWLSAEGAFRDHLVHPHHHGQGCLSPDQERPLQPNTELIQWWGIHSFPGNLSWYLTALSTQNMFLTPTLNLSA